MPAGRAPGIMMSSSGFTLMEVLIAVTITSVIGIGVWQVITSVVTSRDRVNEAAGTFEGLQKTMLLLERDLTQVVNRPARDDYGDFRPAFTSREQGYELMLTRQGWRNPLGLRRSNLQRVAWEYTGEELRRHYWPMVDQGQEDDARHLLLLGNVLDFDMRFLDEQNNWRESWPTQQDLATVQPGSRPEFPLPRGIEITLEHERFGELVRVFTLPDFDPGQAQALFNQQADNAESGTDGEEAGEQQETVGAGS